MSWSTGSLKKTSVWPRLLPGSLHWTDTSWRQRQWCTAQSLPASTLCQRLCLFHCLHLTGKPWAVPVLRNLRKITVTLKKKKIDVQTYIFGIIAFANWNKEKAGDPHWNNPRDLCVLPEDFRCCCELGLCTSSRDLLWSMSWGGSYSQHDIPALASCGLLVVFSGIWNRLSLLAVLDRSPKLGLEVAAYSFPKRSKDAQLGGHSSLLRGLLAFHCEGLLQSRK